MKHKGEALKWTPPQTQDWEQVQELYKELWRLMLEHTRIPEYLWTPDMPSATSLHEWKIAYDAYEQRRKTRL